MQTTINEMLIPIEKNKKSTDTAEEKEKDLFDSKNSILRVSDEYKNLLDD